MRADVYNAFRAINVPEDQAIKAAEALEAVSHQQVDMAGIRSDVVLLK